MEIKDSILDVKIQITLKNKISGKFLYSYKFYWDIKSLTIKKRRLKIIVKLM